MMAPMRLRRRMSRLTRKTEKLVARAPTSCWPSVWIVSAPMLNGPMRPVRRPPPRIGTVRVKPSSLAWRPMRRLKKMTGASPPPKKPPPAVAPPVGREAENPPPPPKLAPTPKSKMPRLSRKKSRFSGKKRLKRVRLTCCWSTSTCAKSVL